MGGDFTQAGLDSWCTRVRGKGRGYYTSEVLNGRHAIPLVPEQGLLSVPCGTFSACVQQQHQEGLL